MRRGKLPKHSGSPANDELRRAEAPTGGRPSGGSGRRSSCDGWSDNSLNSFPSQLFLPSHEMTFERAEAAYY